AIRLSTGRASGAGAVGLGAGMILVIREESASHAHYLVDSTMGFDHGGGCKSFSGEFYTSKNCRCLECNSALGFRRFSSGFQVSSLSRNDDVVSWAIGQSHHSLPVEESFGTASGERLQLCKGYEGGHYTTRAPTR